MKRSLLALVVLVMSWRLLNELPHLSGREFTKAPVAPRKKLMDAIPPHGKLSAVPVACHDLSIAPGLTFELSSRALLCRGQVIGQHLDLPIIALTNIEC